MLSVLRSWFRSPEYLDVVKKSALVAVLLLGTVFALSAIGR